MRMNLSKLQSILYISASLLRDIAFKMFNFNVFNSTSKQCDTINEVLLYGAKDKDRTRQIGLNNLFCIHNVIIHASRSIDVCLPSLVSETISLCLISVQQKKNIKIRVTIHNSANFHNLQSFAQNGIEVKVIKTAERLEHEFILIDASEDADDAVAVMGSLDYETTRVNCNRDATVLTSEATVVQTLKREFDRVWHSVPEITNDTDS